jgi:predicted nicotinamide N-methyase
VTRVIATDVDRFALQLVEAAAAAQDLVVQTALFYLVSSSHVDLPLADLYVLSDVFEWAAVSRGAAAVTRTALEQGLHVWVFAQSDRAQREVYLEELQGTTGSSDDNTSVQLTWSSLQDGHPTDGSRLWLCNVDETTVFYG